MLASRETRTACHACGHAFAADALFCPNCGTAKARDTADDPLLGATVGDRYALSELIGMGASGTIYRAEHVTLRRRVAVKVLHHELSRDDLAVERFRRQATTVGQIENDHIVEVHDFGRTPDGRLYLAMEYLEGETLAERLESGALEIDQAVDILIQLGEALIESHAIGYVHRDLRPRNLFLAVRRGEPNFLKLLDFGLSKLVASEGEAASTSLGMTFGDPHYMSPEQARGEPIDRRADIYSMGCIAYQMLTGEPPFTGGRVFDVLARHVEEEPEPPSRRRPEIPGWLDQLVLRSLAKNPGHRFITVYRVVEALREGLATGKTMDDKRARSPETQVPPSVSRVWELLADRLDSDGRMDDADDTRFGADTEVDVAPGRQTALGVGAAGSRARRRSSARIVTPVTDDLTEPSAPPPNMPEPSDGVPGAVPPEPTPPPSRRRRRSSQRPVTKLPALKLDVAEPDSDDPEDMRVTRAIARTSEARGDQPPPAREAGDSFDDSDEYDYYDDYEDDDSSSASGAGITGDWYADGEALGDSAADDEPTRPRAVRESTGPSHTDEVLFEPADDDRLKWVIGGVGAVVVVIAAVLIIGGGDDDTDPVAGQAPPIDAAVLAQPETTAPPEAIADAAPTATPDAAAVVAAKPDKPDVEPGSDRDRDRPKTRPADRPKPRPKGKPKNEIDLGLDKPDRPEPDKPEPDTKPDEPDRTASRGDNKRRADFFAQVGRKHLAGGNVPAAAKEFRKALKLDPSNGRAVTGLGQIALRAGAHAAAVKHLERASRLRSGSSSVHALLGEAYLRAGNRGAAARAFKKALGLNPDNRRAQRGLAEAGG